VLLVEVLGDDAQSRMADALTGAGVTSVPRGSMLSVDATGGGHHDVRDLIRDTASDLGLGLVRLQVDHRRIEDVFADPADPADTADPDGSGSHRSEPLDAQHEEAPGV
jgi:ABC-2 type transport system ATP-binding protein